MIDQKYREIQLQSFRTPDEKILRRIEKAYDGECLGYHKTSWCVCIAVVKIGEKYEFCYMDEHYINPQYEYNSWGKQIIDVSSKPGWDLYFEIKNPWHWISEDAINAYFDYVKAFEKPKPAPVMEKPKLISKTKKQKKKVEPIEEGEQIDLFDIIA